MQPPLSYPPSLADALVPPFTPSGRPIPRIDEPVSSFYEMASLVARGRMVHPTVAGVDVARRDDTVAVPLTGLPPFALGLIWCTAHENARIRALAATVAAIAPPTPAEPAPRAARRQYRRASPPQPATT